MIGMTVKTVDDTNRVKKAADKATFKNLGHASASIRKDAVGTIERSPEPSPAGTPPHTRRGQAKRAVRFAVDKDSAVIGFAASVVGEAMSGHEHGDEYKGDEFPERPTMGPALERNQQRFASDWAGSIGE